ncbi:MAG: ABC transporter permease [Desulfatiglandaceae bacterium]
MRIISKRHLNAVLGYLAAALVMIYLSYCLPGLLPGDFVTAMYSGSDVTLSSGQEAELRAFYTEKKSFGGYLVDLMSLEWGDSFAYRVPVSKLFLEALPWTLLLMGCAHVFSMFFGFIAGVEAAWRRGSFTEKLGVGVMTVLQGVPEIGSGVLLLLVFALNLGWFPAGGAETAYADQSASAKTLDLFLHLVLPLATLILAYFPGNFLLARASMVMILKQRFIQTARAKGLKAVRIRYAHAARNALIPVVTRFGLRFAFMITGALVVETIFSYPGLGTLLFNAISMRDLPLIQAVVLISSLMVLAVNLMLELSYTRLDPRVRDVS